MAEKKVKKEKVELESGKIYKIKSTGKSENMPKDEVYEVGSDIAEILINNESAILID